MTAPKRWHPNPQRRRNIRRRLAKRDGARCFYCRTPFPDLAVATIDHVVPFCVRPSWEQSGLVLACLPCNRRKGNRPVEVFLAELGRS